MKLDEKENKTNQKATKCPSTYIYNAELNLCWRLEKDMKADWLTAGWHCHTEGGHLMILDSMATVKFMQYFLVTAASNINFVYVGGTDGMEEGKFKWINGKPVEARPWRSGQPNGNTNQNCLVMGGADTYDFYDIECSSEYNFLCQILL